MSATIANKILQANVDPATNGILSTATRSEKGQLRHEMYHNRNLPWTTNPDVIALATDIVTLFPHTSQTTHNWIAAWNYVRDYCIYKQVQNYAHPNLANAIKTESIRVLNELTNEKQSKPSRLEFQSDLQFLNHYYKHGVTVGQSVAMYRDYMISLLATPPTNQAPTCNEYKLGSKRAYVHVHNQTERHVKTVY